MTNQPRGRPRRRAHVSAYTETWVSNALDEAADHHSISLSELVNRILAKACDTGFPSDTGEFHKQFPLHYEQ